MNDTTRHFDPEPCLAITLEQADDLLAALRADKSEDDPYVADGHTVRVSFLGSRFHKMALEIWRTAGLPTPTGPLILSIDFPPGEPVPDNGMLRDGGSQAKKATLRQSSWRQAG